MNILGIETSCDETAAAVVKRHSDGKGVILSNVVKSQTEDHELFGGVVPEIAARAHVSMLDRIIEKAMTEANLTYEKLDGVAVTAGPGLIGGLLVGLTMAKGICIAANKPLLAINHLEGHALTARLTHHLDFPYLLLLVSGGHTQYISVNGIGNYERLGSTIDDALGEAFDKTAKLLGLPYPGGPAVEEHAKKGDHNRFAFPRPLLNSTNLDMSFAGLKTAVRVQTEKITPIDDQDVADICASFQEAITDILISRTKHALTLFAKKYPNSPKVFVIAGGVASNIKIRDKLQTIAEAEEAKLVAPPIQLCTDNGAMIAWAGAERLNLNLTDPLDVAPRPRWPLDETSDSLIGYGKRGPKV